MELLEYWNPIRKRIWLIGMLMCIALAGAGFYVMRKPPQYRTYTTLAINPATLDSAVSFQLSDGMLPLANTYSEFMRTRSFAQLVAQNLQEQKLPFTPTESEISSAIIAQYINNTQLYRITVTYRDPMLAKAMADTTAEMLVEANAERIRSEQTALLRAQLDTRRVQEIDRLAEATNLLRTELTYYEDQIQALERQLEILRDGPQSSDTDAKVLETRNELLDNRSARVELLGNLAAAQQALLAETERANSQIDTVVIVEEAYLPDEPLPRNILQPLLAAMAAAMGLGIVLAIGLEYLDASVKSPEELDRIYGLPSLGAIGRVDSIDGKSENTSSLIMLHAPHTPIAETIRVLRTAVGMAGINKPIRSLLVTSARLGEGKTFISTNLAINIAQTGKRVLLVDADLRRPQVHRTFGLCLEPGFTNLLMARDLDLAQVLQRTPVANLRILACGTLPPNPAELLSMEQAAALMQRLLDEADVVIYDSSPATTVTDAVIIAPQVDGVIQVVNARGTRFDLVQRCKDLLERSGARVIGAVLNRVATADLGYYSNYYHSNSYYTDKHSSSGRKQGWHWPSSPRNEKVEAQSRAAMPGVRAPSLARDNGHSSEDTTHLRPGNSNPFRRPKQK